MGRKVNANLLDAPLGPLRDKRVVDISNNDFVDTDGFIVVAAADGDLVYRTLNGDADQTENGLTAGDSINVAGVPVLCTHVRSVAGSSTTVTSIVVGYI